MVARKKRKAGKRRTAKRVVHHTRKSVALVDSIPVVKTLPYYARLFILALLVLIALKFLLSLI